MLLAMPVFNGLFTKSDNPNSSSIEDMFTPFTYLDTVSNYLMDLVMYIFILTNHLNI